MALRGNEQPIAGLSYYWQNAAEKPTTDWKKWIELFEVALMAKFSIAVEEIVREEEGTERRTALMGGHDVETAPKKAVSILFLALGEAARKTITDRKPERNVKQTCLKELLYEANQAFQIKKNRTLERHAFLSRKQMEGESLEQFWNVLNGMAAKCELNELTKTLVYDVFILNMRNTIVQERLLTEPKEDPEEALQFAVGHEQGVQQKKHIGRVVCIKDEPIFAVEGSRDCMRCGAKGFHNGTPESM